jgi:hypothetical protein
MASEPDLLSPLLTQLDRISRAPMTGQERESRANSILGDTLEVRDVAGAMTREELTWNAEKASEHGVPIGLWLGAVEAADIPASATVAQLVERMHRADAMAEMIKAGYQALTGWAKHGKG